MGQFGFGSLIGAGLGFASLAATALDRGLELRKVGWRFGDCHRHVVIHNIVHVVSDIDVISVNGCLGGRRGRSRTCAPLYSFDGRAGLRADLQYNRKRQGLQLQAGQSVLLLGGFDTPLLTLLNGCVARNGQVGQSPNATVGVSVSEYRKIYSVAESID